MLLLIGFLYLVNVRNLLNMGIVSFDPFIIVLGIAVGLLIGAPVYLRQLRDIEEKGEHRASLKIVVLQVLIVVIVVSVTLYLTYSSELSLLLKIFSFLFPLAIALVASRIVLFLRWEKSHKMLIMLEDSLALPKMYAVPKKEKV